MPVVAVWMDAPYLGDRLFDPSSPLNRDDCLAPFRLLRDRVVAGGGRMHTVDVLAARGERPDLVLFFDVPSGHAASVVPWADVPRWVVLFESEVVLPRNWDPARQAEFALLFTWRDPLVDGIRFRSIRFPNRVHEPPVVDVSERRTLCTMIAGHKRSPHPLELYSRRLETVRWFEEHHPDDFHLYGVGWDRPERVGPRLARLLELLHLPTSLFGAGRPSYRGRVEAKAPTLCRYRFAICYENARDIPGYVTEKLFDCLTAPVVPVYWGPGEIERHVPATCFVDRRRFASHDELYLHLRDMPDDRYQDLLDAGRSFLASPAAAPFSAARFVDVLTDAMAGRPAPVSVPSAGRGDG